MKHLNSMVAVLCSLFVASNAFALGSANIGNEVISARMLGQGAVGVAAQNDDPMVGYLNPAGLTNLKGTNLTLGATYENLHGKYTSNTGSVSGMRAVDIGVPDLGVTQSFMDGALTAGLVIGSPYGLETHWAGDSPLRYQATNSVLHIVDVSPAVGYKITPQWSVGVGADYVNVLNALLEKHLSNDVTNTSLGSPTVGNGDGNSRLQGSAANWGFHTGVTWQPNEQHAFGLTYHNKVVLNVNGFVNLSGLKGIDATVFGGSDYTTSAYTTVTLPQNIQFGYAYKPNDKWMIEADAAWYDWFSSQDLNIRYPAESSATRLAVLNAGNPEPFTDRDAWSFGTGANYKWSDALQLRGGLWYEPWASPESTFTPALMDLTRTGLTAGFGYAFNANWGMDFAYNAIFFNSRVINNTIGAAAATSVNGTYDNFANLVSASVNYHFGK